MQCSVQNTLEEHIKICDDCQKKIDEVKTMIQEQRDLIASRDKVKISS